MMNKAKLRKAIRPKRQSGRNMKSGNRENRILVVVLRSFLAGICTAAGILCLMSLVFANTTLPLAWIGPGACAAAALGAFVSGLIISMSVPRFKLLSGLGFGAFYCSCAVVASLLNARIPSADSYNLSLLAVLLLGALTGSAAGALQCGGRTAGTR